MSEELGSSQGHGDVGSSSLRSDPKTESDDIIKRLRLTAEGVSRAHHMIALAKSERNRAAGDELADYSWPTPEQTLEWQAADALERGEVYRRKLVLIGALCETLGRTPENHATAIQAIFRHVVEADPLREGADGSEATKTGADDDPGTNANGEAA